MRSRQLYLTLSLFLLNLLSGAAYAQLPYCTGSTDLHVWYIDTSQHIDDICQDNGTWQVYGLTGAGVPLPTPGSPLTNYYFSGQEHVAYIGGDSHVHQLYLSNGTWIAQDLTTAAGAVSAESGSPLTSYVANVQSIFYLSADGHVRQLYWYSGRWIPSDLTANATPAATNSSLTSYIANVQSVIYTSSDGHIRQLYFYNNVWNPSDLTANTGAPVAESGSPLASHYNSYNGLQDVYYVDSSGGPHRLFFSRSCNCWQDGGRLVNDALAPSTGFTSYPIPTADNIFFQIALNDDIFDGSSDFTNGDPGTALTGFPVVSQGVTYPTLFYLDFGVLTYKGPTSVILLTGSTGVLPQAPIPATGTALTSRIGP